MKRWVNQPSTLQPLHQYHGKNIVFSCFGENGNVEVWIVPDDIVKSIADGNWRMELALAEAVDTGNDLDNFPFLKGKGIMMNKLALSKGWLTPK